MKCGGGAVFYLHGLIDEGMDAAAIQVVLGDQEFEDAYLEPCLTGTLTDVLLHERVFFAGCRLSEPALDQLLLRCAGIKEDFFLSLGLEPPRHVIALPSRRPIRPQDPARLEEYELAMRRYEEDMVKAEQYYAKRGISILWYKPMDEDHTGLKEIVQDLAGVKPPIPKTGYEGLYDEYPGIL